MIPAPNGALALAAAIAAMDRDELLALLIDRRITGAAAIDDPLGLAIELLRADSVRSALRTLNRAELAALRGLDDPDAGASGAIDPDDSGRRDRLAALRRRGLVGRDAADEDSNAGAAGSTVPLPEVSAVLRELEAELGGSGSPAEEPVSAPSPTATGGRADAAAWFGSGLAAVSRSAALLRVLTHRPARLSRKGAITVTAQRELAAATHDEAERTARLLRVLQRAGLVAPFAAPGSPALLWPTPASGDWLARAYPERWLTLAQALTADLSPALRRTIELGGPDADLRLAAGPLLAREFPLLPEAATAEAAEWAATAELLGVAVEGRLSPPAAPLLEGDRDAALACAERAFPPPTPGVYVQPDLSLVVPGPLSPEHEHALTAIADTEQLGAATTMRVSPASLTRALRAGREVAEIRSLLHDLSLTGVPQPLDYLLGDLERKHRAGELHEPRGLRRFERWERTLAADPPPATDAVAGSHALSDPGEDRAAGADAPDGDPNGASGSLEALAERILAAVGDGEGAGELTRRLELAIRSRSPVRITAVGGSSDERTFTLLPVSLKGGRLRATDESAGVERTLPVGAIVAVDLV